MSTGFVAVLAFAGRREFVISIVGVSRVEFGHLLRDLYFHMFF